MLPALLGIPAKLKLLLDRLTATRAGYLDRLDGSISDCAQISDGWDAALAAKLDAGTYVTQSATLTSGTSWDVPAGVGLVWVSLVGGGGSGSVASSLAAYGGGAGAAILRWPYAVTPGGTVEYAIGAGGAAATLTHPTVSGAGNAGGSTTWGAAAGGNQLVAPGGAGGGTGAVGAGGTLDSADTAWTVNGGNGAVATLMWSAGAAASGTSGGGASAFGPGGAAASGAGATASAGTRGGGGGGASVTSGTATSGAGGAGQILIEWVGGAS